MFDKKLLETVHGNYHVCGLFKSLIKFFSKEKLVVSRIVLVDHPPPLFMIRFKNCYLFSYFQFFYLGRIG